MHIHSVDIWIKFQTMYVNKNKQGEKEMPRKKTETTVAVEVKEISPSAETKEINEIITKPIMWEYVRKENNEKIGILCADIIEGKISIGFSVCHKPDTFKFDFGFNTIAIGRLRKYPFKKFEKPIKDRKKIRIPSIIYSEFVRFIDRCKRYYKDKQFVEWIDNGYYIKVDLFNT